MIKVIFFDVGGTMIHPNPSVGAIYAEVAKKHGLNADPADLQARFKQAFAAHDPIKTATKAGWETVVGSVFASDKPKNSQALFEELYAAFRDPARWSVFPDVITTLDTLKKKGVRLAVASNWDDRLPGLLTDLHLAPYFEQMFISYRIGKPKSDPGFFRSALSEMRVEPLEALHVGDHQKEDIESAQAAGMRAYLIDRDKKPLNSRMVRTLTEMLDRI